MIDGMCVGSDVNEVGFAAEVHRRSNAGEVGFDICCGPVVVVSMTRAASMLVEFALSYNGAAQDGNWHEALARVEAVACASDGEPKSYEHCVAHWLDVVVRLEGIAHSSRCGVLAALAEDMIVGVLARVGYDWKELENLLVGTRLVQ